MNFSTYLKLTFQTVILLIAPCGCSPNHSATEKQETHELLGAAFKEGKGLELSEQTKKALGLEIVEVAEEKLLSTFVVPVQIYREASVTVVSSHAKPNRAYGTGIVSAEQAKQLKIGQVVHLELAESNAEQVQGSLIRLNRYTESALGGIEVLIEIPDSQHRFQVGMLFQAKFASKNEESVTAIPSSALLKTATGTFVYVVNGKHLFRTAVKIGSENGNFIEIKDGLYAGDQVAKQPVLSLWMAELQEIKGGKACADGH